jgi:hypothetical protein
VWGFRNDDSGVIATSLPYIHLRALLLLTFHKPNYPESAAAHYLIAMPAILDDEMPQSAETAAATRLPFPPVTRDHILHCSYHSWHPKYRGITPKTRLIPLTQPCVDYLRADRIILPSDDDDEGQLWDDDSGIFSASDATDADQYLDEDEEDLDPAEGWHETHDAIKATIKELGGQVVPKLNWSAPKDATWMNANTMICHKPSEIYLLLKSSDFVTHDLEHAFDDTVSSPRSSLTKDTIPYHLVLRKAVKQWNPSVEFRCFVRGRRLLCMCQRDLNHFDFLFKMRGHLRSLIQEFYETRLRDFDDENFAFDVYVPPPYDRVWLVDINPWAERTDPLLFSWLEILTMPDPPEESPPDRVPEIVRLSMAPTNENTMELLQRVREAAKALEENEDENKGEDSDCSSSDDVESDADEEIWLPELRLVRKTDPEAYSFNTPRYSAHKLPKDVVDASQSGAGLMEFAKEWEAVLAERLREDEMVESSDSD